MYPIKITIRLFDIVRTSLTRSVGHAELVHSVLS